MALPIHCYIWLYSFALTFLHICFAVIPAVGYYSFYFSKLFGQLCKRFKRWFHLLFVIGLLCYMRCDDKHCFCVHGCLSIISLLESSTRCRHYARFFIGQIDLIFVSWTGCRRRGSFVSGLLATLLFFGGTL